MFSREINKLICSCGGEWKFVGITAKEAKEHGCHHDKAGDEGCCVQALQCDKCKTRITAALEAPEME